MEGFSFPADTLQRARFWSARPARGACVQSTAIGGSHAMREPSACRQYWQLCQPARRHAAGTSRCRRGIGALSMRSSQAKPQHLEAGRWKRIGTGCSQKQVMRARQMLSLSEPDGDRLASGAVANALWLSGGSRSLIQMPAMHLQCMTLQQRYGQEWIADSTVSIQRTRIACSRPCQSRMQRRTGNA